MSGGLGGGRPPGRPVSKLCYQPKLVVLVQMYPLPEFMAAPLGSAKLFRVSPRSIPKPRPAVRRVKMYSAGTLAVGVWESGPLILRGPRLPLAYPILV